MALSRETLISMVKNEYPSSYSAEVEKMSHEDLMGLLDYLDSIKGKADGGRVGMLSGGLLKHGIMSALEQIKNMDEGNLFSKLDSLGKARTIRDALLDRIDGFKEMIKDLKTQGRPIDEIEDIKFEMDEAQDGLKKINKYIENQPTNRTLQADGGAIGIEVLFNPKRKDFASGGWHPGAGRDKKGYQKTHPQHSGGGDGPPSITNPYVPPKKPPVQVSDSDNQPWYNPKKLINNPLLNFVIDPRSKLGMGLNIFKTIKNFQPTEEDVTLGKTSEVISDLPSENLLAFEPGSIKDKKLKKLHNQKTEGLMWNEQNEKTYQKLLEEDKKSETPTLLGADGGRVGFQTGGWADNLEGEAKGIYDSMTAYGASDAEIQSKLQAQGLWSPDAPTTPPGQITGIINQNIGGDGPYPGQVVDQTSFADYQFNKSDYAPGGKLEINPAALGMSFFEQPGSAQPKQTIEEYRKEILPDSPLIDQSGFATDADVYGKQYDYLSPVAKNKYGSKTDYVDQMLEAQGGETVTGPGVKEKGFIESFMSAAVPNKMTSEFRTPTGIIPKGPQELGFMTKDIFGKPYGSANTLTRDQLREMYDNYNKFFGRRSNYVDARVPGTAGNLIGMIPKFGALQKFGEGIFGPRGDRSMQSKYAVDNAGYGNTGTRDEFGLSVVDDSKRIFGKQDRNYLDRMQDKITDNIDFFGGTRWGFGGKELDKKGSSVSLTVDGKTMDFKEAWDNFDTLDTDDQQALIDKMKAINGFKTKQMLAYKNRIATEKINKDWRRKEAEIAEAEKQKENLANATALQKETMAAKGGEGGSGGTFVDRKTGAMKGYEKGAGGGKDAPSEHFYIKDGGIAQHAPQRKGIASMFTRRR